MFRHTIIGIIVAVVFGAAAFLCVSSYRDYALKKADLATVERQARMLRVQKIEMEKVGEFAGEVRLFLKNTGRMGLAPERWAYYGVEVDQAVSFADLKTMLDQAANTSAYYFKPGSLRIKTKLGDEEVELNKEFFVPPPEMVEGEEPQIVEEPLDKLRFAEDQTDEDVIVSMRGDFLVRHK